VNGAASVKNLLLTFVIMCACSLLAVESEDVQAREPFNSYRSPEVNVSIKCVEKKFQTSLVFSINSVEQLKVENLNLSFLDDTGKVVQSQLSEPQTGPLTAIHFKISTQALVVYFESEAAKKIHKVTMRISGKDIILTRTVP